VATSCDPYIGNLRDSHRDDEPMRRESLNATITFRTEPERQKREQWRPMNRL